MFTTYEQRRTKQERQLDANPSAERQRRLVGFLSTVSVPSFVMVDDGVSASGFTKSNVILRKVESHTAETGGSTRPRPQVQAVKVALVGKYT